MKLGVDFPGKIVKYLACYRSGGCDAACEICETYEGAKHAIEGMKRRKSLKNRDDVSFWIMKQTMTAERVWPEDNYPDEFDDEFYAKYEDKEAAAEHEKEQQKRRMWGRKRNESIQD